MPDTKPSVYAQALPAQMGNLNKHSTHPRPFRPPNEWERLWGMGAGDYHAYRIHDWAPTEKIQRKYTFLEDDPFLDNVRTVAFKSWGIGTCMAYNDIVNVHAIDAPRARLARYLYVMPPYVAMGVSFVCAREVLGNLSTEKNASWTWPASVLAPATIWGIFRNSFERGLRFMLLGSIAAYAYKYNQEHGHIMHGGLYGTEGTLGKDNWTAGSVGAAPLENDPEKGSTRIRNWDAQGWKGQKGFWNIDSVKTWWTPTEEPDWKKHVSPEEAKRGPPTNF